MFGKAKLPTIVRDVPLSYSLVRDGSLTRQKATHLRTGHFGVRKDYIEAYRRWHKAALATGDFALKQTNWNRRRFPAPAAIRSKKPDQLSYDTLIISDFSRGTATLPNALRLISQALECGLHVAIFHWPHYDRPANLAMDRDIAALLDRFEIDGISAGEQVQTKLLVLCDPLRCAIGSTSSRRSPLTNCM